MSILYLIINERIFNNKRLYYCENKDIQSIVNYLSNKYNLTLISRHSKFIKPFVLNKIDRIFNRNLKIFFFFLKIFFNSYKKKIFIISITPFNFIIFLIFKIFSNCRFYLYLRSNGYEEYENILGKKYIWIYSLMFNYITKYSEVISCHKRLYRKKCHILYPSELNSKWFKKVKKSCYKNNIVNILYVGRFKIEKGIYSLLNIFSDMPTNFKLKLVGSGDPIKINDNRIELINFINEENKLINIYDSSNIVILPSYTEAYPKVIDESLSRMRPVIIFDDIKYVIKNRYGIFSSKRSSSQLLKIINYIKNNQQLIYKEMKKNKLPKKINFLEDLNKIISYN